MQTLLLKYTVTLLLDGNIKVHSNRGQTWVCYTWEQVLLILKGRIND